jgi:hypothetical protein
LANCECNIAALLEMSYDGIISAAINGGTTVEISESGLVLLGATVNTLAISAYAYEPGQDRYLGASCPLQASASIPWVQKYDCVRDTVHFIPKSGSKASISGGTVTGGIPGVLYLDCDPNVTTTQFTASVQNGPVTPYISNDRRDGFNLVYAGRPIPINSGSPQAYTLQLGPSYTIRGYLQSFNLNINHPSPATVNYSFVFTR